MYYLSPYNRSLFKSYYCYVIFGIQKALQILWKIFLIPSLFSKNTSFLTNIRNKCVIREINIYILMLWKMAKFFLQRFVIFSMVTNSKLRIVFFWNFSSCLNIRIFWGDFLLFISCKIFWYKLQIFVLKKFEFLVLY